LVSEAVLQNVTLAVPVGNLLVIRRLDAVDDDVLTAEIFDLLLRLVTRAFADGQHRDDRANAKDNSQRRQQRAQAMQPQASHTEANRAFQAGKIEAVNHRRMSLSIWPSESRIARYERSATLESCVTRINVFPC